MPAIIITVTGCAVNKPNIGTDCPVRDSSKGLEAINSADIGIRNIPTVIEVTALTFFIRLVINTTQSITTNGLTFAIHSGEACSPTVLRTYFGIVAYS